MWKPNIGDKVTYITTGKKEYGIVKSIADDEDVFVVYNCGGDWDHYQDYTAAKTHVYELHPGWV